MLKKFCMYVLFSFLPMTCLGQLQIDMDLGTLTTGTYTMSGDTTSFGSETDYYGNTTNTAANWGNEIVYQFTVTEAVLFNITKTAATGDPDFFLLDGVEVDIDGAGKTFTLHDLAPPYFLDGGIPESGTAVGIPAGTYYISASTFAGFDGATTNDQATFTIDVTLGQFGPFDPPTDVIDLGVIADADTAFNMDTFGSVFDTELGVWDDDGILLAVNDDAGGTLQSELIFADGLAPGTYYMGLGQFDTVYDVGFAATTTGTTGGAYTLTYNGNVYGDTLTAGTLQYFKFSIGADDCLLGDVNMDGMVSLVDVAPFVELLTGGGFQCEADVNQDGSVTLLDVSPFVAILTGG